MTAVYDEPVDVTQGEGDTPDGEFDAIEFVEWMVDADPRDAVEDLRGMPFEDFYNAYREWSRTREGAGWTVFNDPELREATLQAVRQSIRSVTSQLRRLEGEPEWRQRAERARELLREHEQSLKQELAVAAKAGNDPVKALRVYEAENVDLRAQVEQLRRENERLQEAADKIRVEAKVKSALAEAKAARKDAAKWEARAAELEVAAGTPEAVVDTADLAGMSREQLEVKVKQLQRKTMTLNKRIVQAEAAGGRKRR